LSIASKSHSAIRAGAATRLDVSGGPSIPDPLTGEQTRPGEGDDAVAARQCGRCRAMFPGDLTLYPVALPDWWLCPACRLALLGPGRPMRGTAGSDSSIGARRAN
jgi:hypothetical protein